MNAPIAIDVWRLMTRAQRASAWQHWSDAERALMYEQFAATTPGWGLPYPSDYNDPADSPNTFRALAEAVDADLTTVKNGAMAVNYSQVNISRTGGWGHANYQPVAMKTGKLVVLSSRFARGTELNVTSGTAYALGSLPAGYRPPTNQRFACAWEASGTLRVAHVHIAADGEMSFYPTASVHLDVEDWLYVSGIVFMTG